MARNPVWRKTAAEWREQVALWARRRSPVAILFADIFFDFRAAAGPVAPAEELRAHVTQVLKAYPALLSMMSRDETARSVALGFFGGLRTDRSEEAQGRVDLKLRGTMPLVSSVRLWALKHGVAATGTLARLADLREAGAVNPDDADEFASAFERVTFVLLRQQLRDAAAGRAVASAARPTRCSRAAFFEARRSCVAKGLHRASSGAAADLTERHPERTLTADDRGNQTNIGQGGSVPLHRSRICKGCWQQMRVPVPLRGPAAIPFRLFGIRPSRMNPNTCTICEMMFTRVMKARKITVDVSVLFADLRSYTTLSQSLPPDTVTALLDSFYDECAAAIWEYDGLLNKTIGDAVMAIFNFPIRQADHAGQAVLAAREILRRCQARREVLLRENPELKGSDFGVGIGIDSGNTSFGEFGRSHRDLTAIGMVVNTAARAQAAAEAGRILVTQAVFERAGRHLAGSRGQDYQLKGFEKPISLYAI